MILAEKDMRDAFFEELYSYGAANKDVVIIANDMDAFSLKKFKKDYPNQFINAGVAEQNMVNVAAGLASCGKRVFIYGITSFVTLRCYEQIKFNVCSMNLPVTIVGMGSGFSFGFDGPTHHNVQDLSIMRALPGMTILSPCDSVSASKCVEYISKTLSPAYVRIDKGALRPVYEEKDTIDGGFKVARPLGHWNILSTGYMTSKSLEIAEKMEEFDIHIGVVDMCRIKPINKDIIRKCAVSGIIVVEEHSKIGGLGSAISDCLAETVFTPEVIRISLRDDQCLQYGSREWLHRGYAIDVESVVKTLIARLV